MANGFGNGNDTGSFSRLTVSASTVLGWIAGSMSVAILAGIGYSNMEAMRERISALEAGRTTPMSQETRYRVEALERLSLSQTDVIQRLVQKDYDLQGQINALNEQLKRDHPRP